MGYIVILAGLVAASLWVLTGAWQAALAWSSGSVRRRAVLVCAGALLLVALETTAFIVDPSHRPPGRRLFGPGVLLFIGVLTLFIGLHAFATGSWSGPNLPTPLRVLYLLIYLLCAAALAMFAVAGILELSE